MNKLGKTMVYVGRTRSVGIGGYSAFINRTSSDNVENMNRIRIRKAFGESGFSPKQLASIRRQQKTERRRKYGND